MAEGPLAGVRILEFGQVIAGNYAGVLLADMGAEVVKVESAAGDPARNPAVAELHGESALHLTVNRGKKSIVLDLKAPEGRQLFLDLVESADAVLDNFRPGVLERLAIDYEHLRQINPAIISVSVSGFGQDGPARNRPAFDLVVQAFSGHMSITGEPGRDPVRMGAPMADLAGGMFGAMSVLAALVGRDRTGRGRRADVSMLDSLVSLLGYDATIYLNTGAQLGPQGNSNVHMVPWAAFPTSDGHVAITARDDRYWRRLCQAIDRPELAEDPRCLTNADRVANRDWVLAELRTALAARTTAEWVGTLEAFDVPAGPVNDFAGVFADPQVVARQLVQTYDDPTLGPVRHVAAPTRFDGWTPRPLPPPRLGEHTAEVLRDRLGLDDERIGDLVRRGIVLTAAELADGEGAQPPVGAAAAPVV